MSNIELMLSAKNSTLLLGTLLKDLPTEPSSRYLTPIREAEVCAETALTNLRTLQQNLRGLAARNETLSPSS